MDPFYNDKSDPVDIKTEHVEEQGSPATIKEERKLVRKIDFRVLPWLCILYGLSLIDRTNISAAKIAGMSKDLVLVDNRYSVALLIFFITYTMSEIPSNLIIRQFGTRYYLAFLILTWGTTSMCHGFLQTYEQLYALRILLGLFEGGFAPACIYIISSWYKRYETQQRLAIWFMTGSVITGFNGIISYGLTTLNGTGGLAGWRWIFIIPGLITAVLSVPVYLFVPEFPEKAKFLKPHELQIIRDRLSADRGEVLEDRVDFKTLMSAVTDWKVFAISFMYIFPTAGAYALAFFTPTILNTFGFSVALSQILATPTSMFAAILSIGSGIWADRIQKRSPFIIGYCVLAIAGLILIGWGPNTGGKLTGLFLASAGLNACIPAQLAFLANNVVGSSKRQVAVPIQTVFAGVGGIIGSTIFRDQDYPRYLPGLYATMGCMAGCIFMTAGITLCFRRENQKADKEGKILEGLPGFRYTL